MSTLRRIALLLALVWHEKGGDSVWVFGSAELLGFKPTRVIVQEIRSDGNVNVTEPT